MPEQPTDGTTPTGQQQQPAGGATQEPPKKDDEQLGPAGLKALEAERTARKQAETQLSSLRTEFDTFKGALGKAFGVNGETTPDDAISKVQERLDQMQLDNAVYRLAAQHQITDTSDLQLLRSATDEAAMVKLAERLAVKPDGTKPNGTPKPDATQGGTGGPGPSKDPAQDFAAFLQAQLGQGTPT